MRMRYSCFRVSISAFWGLIMLCGAVGAPLCWSADEDCVGCPYFADGECVINPYYYGHYTTEWRRWPGEAQLASVGTSSISDEIPARMPSAEEEGDFNPRPDREQSFQGPTLGTPSESEQLQGGFDINSLRDDPNVDDLRTGKRPAEVRRKLTSGRTYRRSELARIARGRTRAGVAVRGTPERRNPTIQRASAEEELAVYSERSNPLRKVAADVAMNSRKFALHPSLDTGVVLRRTGNAKSDRNSRTNPLR